jgi:tetratricopeptide (TPR) repeat protein
MSLMRRFSIHILVLALVVACASIARVPHLGWGLPSVEEEALPSKVAIEMWGFDDGSPDFDPGTAGWPALSFYVQRAAQQLQYVAGRASGEFDEPLDYYVAWLLDPSNVILLGRWTSVVAGLVVCIVATLLGFALTGRAGGLVAGMTCALSPLLARHSQLVEPDALVTAFAALATFWIWRIASGGRVIDYATAGLWIGLGTAAKYTPALLALSLYAVHLERRRTEGRSNGALGLDDRRLGWAALVSVLTFCAASPYTLANLDVLQRDFAYQALHMSSGHFGHEQQGIGYAHYLTEVLPGALGWPGLIAGIAGLGLAFRQGGTARIVVWSLLPFFLVLGSLSTHFDRYMLPAVMPLALGIAFLTQRLPGRGLARGALLATALALLLWAPARDLRAWHELQGTPGTQQLAATWLQENMDVSREVLATERYGPSLPYDQREQVRSDPAFDRMNESQQQTLLERPFVNTLHIPMYAVRSNLAAYYYDLRNFLAYDWLVTSGAVRNRYLRERERFPRQAAFYDLLEELLDPDWSILPAGNARGPALEIYRLDDGFRSAVRERLGPREVEHFRSFGAEVHAPHLLGFVQTIATHATLVERWEEAAFWYEVLVQAALHPHTRALAYEKAGLAHIELGHLPRAREMFTELRAFEAREVVALGNLGLIAEMEGEPELARDYYDQVIAKDTEGRAAAWARQRRAALVRPSAGNGP